MKAANMLALQQVDSALDQIGHRRQRLPELASRDACAAVLRDLDERIAASEAAVDRALALIEHNEHEAADLTTKRERLEQQLKTVISPREAEALMSQIAHLNAQRGELDDQELAALEEQAAGDELAGELRALRAVAEQELAAAEQSLGLAMAALDQERDELLARRSVATDQLTPDELATYERARHQFDGVAVALLDGQRCQGCHLDMSRAELDRIRSLPADELPECPQCGRFLVR
jgi:predicted  nucleic acid-binding Zn-ribbon protein